MFGATGCSVVTLPHQRHRSSGESAEVLHTQNSWSIWYLNYLECLPTLCNRGLDSEILELRRLQLHLITVFKIINGLCELEFSAFFQWSTATMVRGHFDFKLTIL